MFYYPHKNWWRRPMGKLKYGKPAFKHMDPFFPYTNTNKQAKAMQIEKGKGEKREEKAFI